MPSMIDYILKFSISLTGVYLFYLIFLRRLTFYSWNRYLLTYSGISFFIPFINVGPFVGKQDFRDAKIIDYIPTISDYTQRLTAVATTTNDAHDLNGWSMLIGVLTTGSLIMLRRLGIQLISVWKMKRKSNQL